MLKRIILIIFLIIIGLAFGTLMYLKQAVYTPLNKSDNHKKLFVVPQRTSTQNLSRKLKETGLIKSPLAFVIYSKIKRINLQAGQYKFSPSMTIATIVNDISTGKVVEYKVTFPEGLRITQMADILESQEVVKKQDFLKAAQGQEGYLFPDTYSFSSGISANQIVKIMKDNFQQRTSEVRITPRILILASIVEKEISATDDRSKIAGVYTNRLNINMLLQADPTVQYAKGTWDAITQSDYETVISPYNTYLNAGLPPGPICNPGIASIEAAANPAKHEYFYFFHKNGQTVYSKTFIEHQNNLAKY
ncbi:MAG: endolytic transglycosylase MltG [bacterium]|nr:endolytic transglycosylase MltG [bacterium]